MAVSSASSKEVSDSADESNNSSQLSQSLRPQRNRTKPKRFAIEDSIQDEEESSSNNEEEKQISQKENISLQISGKRKKTTQTNEVDFFWSGASKKKQKTSNQLEVETSSHSNLQLEFSTDNSATFVALSHSKCNIQVLCDDLIGDFLGGREKKCIYELVSLLFNAGGSKFICFQDFTKEDVVAVEAIEFIQERILQCKDDENSLLHEFPFESKVRETKRFPKAFSDFWSIFIQRAFSSILMHDSLLPLLFDWACAMTSCKYRHFRLVATVAVFGVVSGLAKGIAFHQGQLEICQKLKASASKKRGRKAALAFLDEVQASSCIAFGQNQISALLDAVFIHRIRDIDPKIRKEAIFSLSQWICTLPATFNEHLPILAPSLADEKAPVREATLEALIQISNVPESQNSIREFLSASRNCKQRLIDISLYDLSNVVKILALQLVSILICDLKIISLDQEFEKLKMLIFHSSQQVRQACIPIVRHFIEANWTLSIEGLCSFLQRVDRCNSGEIIFPLFKEYLSVGALREKLEQIAGAGGMQVKVILDFLAAALKDSSEASKTLSVDSFVELMQITKEHSNSILNVLLSMDSALWAERLDVLKVQVLPQLFSFITNSCSWETIRKSVEVLYSLTQNPLLTASIQGQKEAFVSQLTAELAAFCSENHFQSQDLSSQTAASVQSCCWRVECLCEWEHVPVDFLRIFLENSLSVADISPVHHLQEPVLISCMKALLKSHLHLNAFKLPDSIFDLCFLAFSSTSWPKLQASLASMLADHFIFAQNCDSLLVERIRQVLTQQLRLMSSTTGNNAKENGESMMMVIEESQVFTLIKLMVFEMIPAKDSLKEIVAYLAVHEARWSDRLEALFGCSLKRLLSNSQASSKQVAISLLDALVEAFLLSQSGALKIGQMVADNLKLNLMWFFGDEAFVEFMQKIIFSLNDDSSDRSQSKSMIFSAFELATPFVQFLGREQCSRIIELLNDDKQQQQFPLESKQQQSQWNEFVAKLKSRMLKKAPSGGKRGRKPKASSSLAISNASSLLSDDEVAVGEGEIDEGPSLERSVEEEDENPFASSPMLPVG